MEYNRSSSKEKWTIMMYMRDFDLMLTYAYALRASNRLSEDNIDEILLSMENDGIYHPRNGGSTFTGQFKSIQIAWYMFGHYNKHRNKNEEKKMVFSPLGNLLLDNLKDREKVRRIFLTMLYANGFRQPFSQMDERFNIFAFRLIFKLLRDPRLDGKLYNDEVFYLVMFLKTIDPEQYENLVQDILLLRQQNPYKKLNEFKKDERVVGLACHEWRYATGMLMSAGIVQILNDHHGRSIGELTYGNINPKTGKPNAIRHYTEDYIRLCPDLIPYVDVLLSNYPFNTRPYPDEEIKGKLTSDIVVELYSFYPPELLKEIGMDSDEDHAIAAMLEIASNVNYYSHEETSTGLAFEYALTDAFNLFEDVTAQRVGGSGNVDIECIYTNTSNIQKKFDIEAKARKTKLIQLNSRRLRTHRVRISSEYTIVVTPDFSIGVLRDIEGEASVIIKSATLANYLYQYILRYGRNLSYSAIDQIAATHKGQDITSLVNAYVYSNFGHTANDMNVKLR